MVQNCVICKQLASWPVTEECGHVFCFACLKKNMWSLTKCPVCKEELTYESLAEANEQLLDVELDSQRRIVWAYSNRSGDAWWCYRKDISDELEELYAEYVQRQSAGNGPRASPCPEITISGNQYCANFSLMQQMNKHDMSKNRGMKRIIHPGGDLKEELQKNHRVIGVAGIPW